jgi:hypothetical protein
MDLLITHTIFINSKYINANGNTYDFDIYVPVGYIKCNDNEFMRVSPLKCSSYYSWLNIDVGYDQIYFTNNVTTIATTITIDPGNYSCRNLALKISLVDILYVLVPGMHREIN